MLDAGRLIEYVVLDKILGASPAAPHYKAGTGLLVLSGFFIVAGSGFLIAGAYFWLNAHYTPDAAMALTGTLCLAVASVVMLASYIGWEIKRSHIRKMKSEVGSLVQATLKFLESELSEPVSNNPKTAAFLASLAGFQVGEKLH